MADDIFLNSIWLTQGAAGGGGGGAVDSVNGKTGNVVLDNVDVNAMELPDGLITIPSVTLGLGDTYIVGPFIARINKIEISFPGSIAKQPDNLLTFDYTYLKLLPNNTIFEQSFTIDNSDYIGSVPFGYLVHKQNVVTDFTYQFAPLLSELSNYHTQYANNKGPSQPDSNFITYSATDNTLGTVPSPNIEYLRSSSAEISYLGINIENDAAVPNLVALAASPVNIGIAMEYRWQGFSRTPVLPGFGSPEQAILWNVWDNGTGGPTTPPNGVVGVNQWSFQINFYLPGEAGTVMQFGQEVFANKSAAEAALNGTISNFIVDTGILNNRGIRSTIWLLRGGGSDLTNTSDAERFVVNPNTGGITSGVGSPIGLQVNYLASPSTEIVSDAAHGPLTMRMGTEVGQSDKNGLYQTLDQAGIETSVITGEGELTAAKGMFESLLLRTTTHTGTNTPTAYLNDGANLAGTVALTIGSNIITGTLTTFLTDFAVGDIIRVNSGGIAGLTFRVVSVGTDLQMTVLTNAPSSSAGITYSQTGKSGISVEPDVFIGNTFHIVLNDDATLEFPSQIDGLSIRDGFPFIFRIEQDSVGGHILSFAAGYEFIGGIVPIITATAGAKDKLVAQYLSLDNVVEITGISQDIK